MASTMRCIDLPKERIFFREKEYSNTLQIIEIVPIIAPQEVYAAENYKARVKFLCGKSVASVEIRVDFDAYHNAGSSGKIALTKDFKKQ